MLFCLSLIIFNKTYTVVNFDVEQGRIIIRENPKYLSLNEMYQVANSYPKGSKDFVNVFDIAVRMYPTDAVANLNAGAVALSQKDLNAAVKFMEKADHNTAEFINNTGVYNFLNGDINRAMATRDVPGSQQLSERQQS